MRKVNHTSICPPPQPLKPGLAIFPSLPSQLADVVPGPPQFITDCHEIGRVHFNPPASMAQRNWRPKHLPGKGGRVDVWSREGATDKSTHRDVCLVPAIIFFEKV